MYADVMKKGFNRLVKQGLVVEVAG
jgi:hypothetical protein